MTQRTQLQRDEERRLLTVSEECIARERAAGDQLLHPGHSMLYPEAMRLANTFQFIRNECRAKWLAFRAYQKQVRDDRQENKRNSAAVLQAHSLSVAAAPQFHLPPKDASGPRYD
jgi:uncharacterized protein (DUF2236 family)